MKSSWKAIAFLLIMVSPILACGPESGLEAVRDAPEAQTSDAASTVSIWIGSGERLVGPLMELDEGEVRVAEAFERLGELDGQIVRLRGYVLKGSPLVEITDAVREVEGGGIFTASGTNLALKLTARDRQALTEVLGNSGRHAATRLEGRVVFTPDGWGPEPGVNGYLDVSKLVFLRSENVKE